LLLVQFMVHISGDEVDGWVSFVKISCLHPTGGLQINKQSAYCGS
jgi:hypothetical protein